MINCKDKVFRCYSPSSPNGYWIGYKEEDCFIPLGYKSNNSKDVEMTSGIRICDQALEGASFERLSEKDIPVGIMYDLSAYSYRFTKKESANLFPLQKQDTRNLCHHILICLGVEFVEWVVRSDALDNIAQCFEAYIKSLEDFAIFYWTAHLLVKRDKASIVTLGEELPNYFDCQHLDRLVEQEKL